MAWPAVGTTSKSLPAAGATRLVTLTEELHEHLGRTARLLADFDSPPLDCPGLPQLVLPYVECLRDAHHRLARVASDLDELTRADPTAGSA